MAFNQKPEPDSEAMWAHIKVPEFMPEDPEAFIALLESRFHAARINSQRSRYDKLLSAIPRELLSNVRDIFMDPPEANPYDALKDALLRRMAISEEKRIQHVLSGIQLGSSTPSQLLRQMRGLIGASMMSEAVLRQVWLRRLPETVQSILAVFIANESLERLAEAADRAMEQRQFCFPQVQSSSIAPTTMNTQPPIVVAPTTAPPSDLQALLQEFASLKLEVTQLRSELRQRHQSPLRSRSRRRRTPSAGGICYYHQRFKHHARKCEPPCKFSSSQGN